MLWYRNSCSLLWRMQKGLFLFSFLFSNNESLDIWGEKRRPQTSTYIQDWVAEKTSYRKQTGQQNSESSWKTEDLQLKENGDANRRKPRRKRKQGKAKISVNRRCKGIDGTECRTSNEEWVDGCGKIWPPSLRSSPEEDKYNINHQFTDIA